MKTKKTAAHAKSDTGHDRPTLAGLPVDADGLDRMMQTLVTAAKMETDAAKFTRTLIALLTGGSKHD